MINIIAAVSEQGVIGNDDTLPWKLPNDLKRFKRLTENNIVLMGRKTLESIGKALPNRINIVVTRRLDTSRKNGIVYLNNLTSAIELAKNYAGYSSAGEKDIFIIGGADIYSQVMDMDIASGMYITRVLGSVVGNRYYPIIRDNWSLQEQSIVYNDAGHTHQYYFQLYKNQSVRSV